MPITGRFSLFGCFYRSRDTPILVPGLVGKRVVHIAAGSGHSAAVTEDGALYTWGKGTYGRLGHGECAPVSMACMSAVTLCPDKGGR